MSSNIDRLLQKRAGQGQQFAIDELLARRQQDLQQLSAAEAGGSFLDYARASAERRELGEPELPAATEFLGEAAQGGLPIGSLFKAMGNSINPVTLTLPTPTQMALGAGALGKGILEPAAGVLGLGGAFLGFRTNKAAEFVSRAAQGLYDEAEVAARASGMSDQEIQAAYDVGGFIGMSLPIVASIKAATMLGRVGAGALQSYPITASVLTDWTAGAIYGGVFHEGSVEERLKNAALESAMWGAFRLIITGTIPQFIGWRRRRAIELDREGRLDKLLSDMENGLRGPGQPIDERDMAGVLDLMQEETFLLQSPEGQDMLRSGAIDDALMAAVKEIGERRWTGNVFRNAGSTIEEVNARIVRMKARYPQLKFSFPMKRQVEYETMVEVEGQLTRVSRTQDVYDVYFGTSGLSSTNLKQLKNEGHFAGQMLQHNGQWVEYVGKGVGKKKKNQIKVRYQKPSGEWVVKHVDPVKDITWTPWAREDWVPTPAWDTAYKDFFAWTQENAGKVAAQRASILEPDLISATRAGQVHWEDDARRAFDQGGAIIHPEEAGLLGEDAVTLVQFKAIDASEIVMSTSETAIPFITRSPRQVGPAAGLSSSGPRGVDIPTDVVAPKWRLSVIDENNAPIAHESFYTLDEAVAAAEGYGYKISQVIKKYPTGAEVAGLISQSGLQRASLLQAPPVTTFEDLFDFWAAARGLPKDAVDYASARIYFKDRMRRWAWDQVPAEERKLFQQIWDAQQKLLMSGELPIEVLAGEKGFYATRLPDGRISMRQIDTGLPMIFGGERTAREGLAKIIRPEKDLPSIIPLGFEGLRAFTQGFPVQALLQFPDNVASLETVRDLNWASLKRMVRNIRDTFIAIERQTGIPLYTDGLDKVLQGREAFLADYDPYAKAIQTAWKGIKKDRRYAIADFWIEAEHRKLNFNDAVAAMAQSGQFSGKEVAAFRRSRAILDDMFKRTNITPERYIETYYSRLRTFYERNGAMDVEAALAGFADMKPSELVHWYEMSRSGELLAFEKDPEMMLHKYVRGVLWKEHIKPHWDKMAILTGTRHSPPIKIKDLPPEHQQRILAQSMRGTTEDSPVLPEMLRKTISEFLNAIRGMPGAGEETARRFTEELFRRIGVTTDSRVLEEGISVLMSTWYGSALALRPATMARNMSQVIWNVYTRQGGKHIGRGLQRTLTEDGYLEVWQEGVLHISEAGVPYGDLTVENMLEMGATGEGPFGMAVASAIRSGLRVGTISRDAARKMLVPYATSDAVSRGWAYFATKFHADEWLTKFEANRVSWAKFEEEGLAFFDSTIKNKFRQVYDQEGRERALRFIGRMGSDEANFLYITGVQPALLQKPLMRPFGMFGTYPLWQLELYFNRMRNGTPAQIAKFAARNAILIGAFANMTYQVGVSFWDWLAPGSAFGWAGGPAVQHLINMHRVLVAPVDQKATAINRMIEDGLRLSFPGQGFIRDLENAATVSDPNQAALSIMLGKHVDDTNWSMDYLYDPAAPPGESFVAPDMRQQMADEIFPMPKNGVLFEFGQPESPLGQTTGSTSRLRFTTPRVQQELEGNIP